MNSNWWYLSNFKINLPNSGWVMKTLPLPIMHLPDCITTKIQWIISTVSIVLFNGGWWNWTRVILWLVNCRKDKMKTCLTGVGACRVLLMSSVRKTLVAAIERRQKSNLMTQISGADKTHFSWNIAKVQTVLNVEVLLWLIKCLLIYIWL